MYSLPEHFLHIPVHKRPLVVREKSKHLGEFIYFAVEFQQSRIGILILIIIL